MSEVNEDNAELIEGFIVRAAEYGRKEFELLKLKALDKTSDVVSSVIPRSAVIILGAFFFLFLNLGLALWLGGIFGKVFYGFFCVAAFYGVAALVFHFFIQDWLKKQVGNYFIRWLLK
jgi:hypothetical protein